VTAPRLGLLSLDASLALVGLAFPASVGSKGRLFELVGLRFSNSGFSRSWASFWYLWKDQIDISDDFPIDPDAIGEHEFE
jgi:hypothetical protein